MSKKVMSCISGSGSVPYNESESSKKFPILTNLKPQTLEIWARQSNDTKQTMLWRWWGFDSVLERGRNKAFKQRYMQT
jgi:hypothetical protein